ncbi:MAG: DUF4012 domain-containing protein [bacterium]|nr:DUF4012 domain-containing protein [bacterium]
MTAHKLPEVEKTALTPTVLIAGGAGFIGAALTEALIRQKARVVVIDNLATGKKTNLEKFLHDPHLLLLEADLNQGLPENIKSVDYIVHLAGQETYLKGNPEIVLDALLTNSFGTKALLDLAKRSGAKLLLASSIDIYQGLVSSLSLENYFGPSDFEERQFSHLEAKRFAEALVWEYFQKYNLDVRIARLAEVYGPKMDLNSGATLGRLINQMLSKEDLIVYGEGLEKEYYLYLDDAVSGLIKALFSTHTAGKIFPLAPIEPITTLELTYLVKSFSPKSIGVTFKPAPNEAKFPETRIIGTENQKIIDWEPKVDLKKGLEKTFTSLNIVKNPPQITGFKIPLISFAPEAAAKMEKLVEKQTKKFSLNFWGKIKESLPDHHPPIKVKQKETKGKKEKVSSKISPAVFFRPAVLAVSLLVIWFGLIWPFVKTGRQIGAGYDSLTKAKTAYDQSDLKKAGKHAQAAAESFDKAKGTLDSLTWLASLAHKRDLLQTTGNLLSVASYASWSATYVSQGLEPLWGAIPSYPPKADFIPLTEAQITDSSVAVNKAFEYLQLAESALNTLDMTSLPSALKSKVDPVKETLVKIRESSETGRALLSSLPEILGYRQPLTYLVLFQNSNELRATGGFIGSYATISLDKGQIKEIKIDDVYNIDGLLDEKKIIFPPPQPLSIYQKVVDLRMRDANWWPDFPTSADKIKSLYELATTKTVDGVIGLDLGMVKNLLSLVGSVYVPAYEETITAETLYERAQYHSEASYFTGSPQKKSFLGELGNKTLEKIFSLEKNQYPALLGLLEKSAKEKHLLLDLPRGPLAALLAKNGWDGSIRPTTGDYLYLVDSNVGATKANFSVERQLTYEVKNTDRQGTLEGTLMIQYQHTATLPATWPNGPYTNYLRLYVPLNTYLQKAAIAGSQLETGGKEITPEVVVGNESGKTVWAYPFVLDPGKNVTLTFTYILPEKVSVTKLTKEYTLLVQKQPGTEDDGFAFSFYPPFGKTVENLPVEFTNLGDYWKVSKSLKEDVEIRIPLK